MRYYADKESYTLRRVILVNEIKKKIDPRPPVVIINVLLEKCFNQVKKINNLKKKYVLLT